MVKQGKGLLTIGIPTYNGGANLRDLFTSINLLGLTNEDYEILIVDNCSDDDTDNIVEQLKLQHPNLRYYKNAVNIGRIENWNKVIELTRGDYLVIMNINDRFLKFDAKKYIRYLDDHPSMPMVFADINTAGYIYPNWVEEGVVNLNTYIKKTFLDAAYLEFNSLGVLHQHIFRTKTIKDNNIHFDNTIPRTTDRVFVAEVVAAGGGSFYYTPQVMVSWHLNSNRYHYSVHNSTIVNFDELWANEYEANWQVAQIAGIAYKDFIKGQLIFAAFYKYVKQVRHIKTFLKIKTNTEVEVDNIAIYAAHLKKIARLNNISISNLSVQYRALKRVIHWFLKLSRVLKGKRSLVGAGLFC